MIKIIVSGCIEQTIKFHTDKEAEKYLKSILKLKQAMLNRYLEVKTAKYYKTRRRNLEKADHYEEAKKLFPLSVKIKKLGLADLQ
jgi:hypothetical protein